MFTEMEVYCFSTLYVAVKCPRRLCLQSGLPV